MPLTAAALAIFVAAEHLGFLVLEMFLWDKPAGLALFRQSPEKAAASRALAANQGLYNGFLAAGLLFSLLRGDRAGLAFFFACVAVAGVFGAATVNRRILILQALPAVLGLTALTLFGEK